MKKSIIMFSFLFIGILLGIGISFLIFKNTLDNKKIDNIEVKEHENIKYYVITGDYSGEYDYQKMSLSEYYQDYEEAIDKIKLYNTTSLLTYQEYMDFCSRWNLKQKYSDNNKKYMIVSYASYGSPNISLRMANVTINNGKITLYLWENLSGVTADITGYFLAVPVDSSIYQSEVIMTYTEEEYQNIVKYGEKNDPNQMLDYKPIIYLYPEKEMEITVKLSSPWNLLTSYPRYHDGWKVLATPDGDIYDFQTNRHYYALYWEGKNHDVKMEDDGFVVQKNDLILFLEDKLHILGLNEREINEFIIYWLPKLEENEYNYIRFEKEEEINNYMGLEVIPKPDTIIRVLMDYQGLKEKINIKEQKLTPQERHGYTVVEWGGTKIK